MPLMAEKTNLFSKIVFGKSFKVVFIKADGTDNITISACAMVSSKWLEIDNLFKSKLTELKYLGLCLYFFTKSISA